MNKVMTKVLLSTTGCTRLNLNGLCCLLPNGHALLKPNLHSDFRHLRDSNKFLSQDCAGIVSVLENVLHLKQLEVGVDLILSPPPVFYRLWIPDGSLCDQLPLPRLSRLPGIYAAGGHSLEVSHFQLARSLVAMVAHVALLLSAFRRPHV